MAKSYHKKSVDLQMDGFIKDLDLLLKIKPGRALYDGADVMADELRRNITELPVREALAERADRWKLPEYQKQALLDGMGISNARVEGDCISIRVGFEGYDGHPTDKYPKGFPLSYLVRALEHGTTFRKPIPLVSNTIKKNKKTAEQKMADNINQQIQEITKK